MTDRKKIISIYAVVGLICLLVVGAGFALTGLKNKRAHWEHRDNIATDIGKADVEVLKTIDGDIELTNQDGEKVRISDLKDKTWVAAQFYASCPMCAARNGDHLLDVYKKYADNDDFHIVCFSIDPEHDTLKHLKDLQKNLEVDSDKWWFVKGDPEEQKRFMIEELGYPEVLERTDPDEAAAKGRWAHDLALEVFAGMDLLVKANLADSAYNNVPKQRALLNQAVEKSLSKKKKAEKTKDVATN